MGFAKVFHFFLFRHLGPHGTFMTFVGEPKFSISSSFSSTWRYTEFYMLELCSMCKMVTLSVGKSVCPCVMWGVIRRDTGNIHVIGVFIRLGTHRLYRCQCYGHLSFEMLYSFRYQMLAQLLSFRYLPLVIYHKCLVAVVVKSKR